jgi:hypothetical protein
MIRNFRLTFILILSLFSFGCVNTESENRQNTLAQSDWISLFDGMSTKGWHSYGQIEAGSAWKVKDSVIYLDTTNKIDWQVVDGGDLVSADTFGNFHLKLEWKISPGGNSGIMFHVQEDTVLYKSSFWTGPEMQVLDQAHPDATEKHMAGDLYDLIAATQRAEKPAGEWNLAEIIHNNGELKFYLNGINTISTIKGDADWNDMVAGSKFSEWSDFGKFSSGHIVLQDHGNEVSFRHIQIKRL